eukprot:12338657-Heterocapsa_arctica.AAC.1
MALRKWLHFLRARVLAKGGEAQSDGEAEGVALGTRPDRKAKYRKRYPGLRKDRESEKPTTHADYGLFLPHHRLNVDQAVGQRLGESLSSSLLLLLLFLLLL